MLEKRTKHQLIIATFLLEIYNLYKSTVFFQNIDDAYTGPSQTSILELFCENSSQYGPKYVSGIPMVSFGGCIYTDTLATNILQKWSMLQNKTNEDFYLLENERKINRKVNTVLNSLKLFHDLFDVGKTKRIRITKMKRALTNTCSNKKELQSKDEV